MIFIREITPAVLFMENGKITFYERQGGFMLHRIIVDIDIEADNHHDAEMKIFDFVEEIRQKIENRPHDITVMEEREEDCPTCTSDCGGSFYNDPHKKAE
jgi:hypothetical protein